MVSRIEVIPAEVRGYGNIVSKKSVSDFIPIDSELVLNDELYTLSALEGINIVLTVSSSSITYGSSVILSATVTDDDTPVAGETVTFYDGSTSLGTDTTDINGVATYTTSSLTAGSHSLTAVYDEKTSNSVTVTVNKLTPSISLTVPASGTVGTSYTVSGTLTPSSGSVKLYENGSLKDTLTVSSGTFSKAITQSNEGTYSYYVVFEGSSTYGSITSTISSIVVSDIPTPSYNGVSLTSDKSILSKADNQSAVLTAQLLDGSSQASVSGVTVTFFNGETSLGTATTNASGVATKTYSATGVGNMAITAEVDSYASNIVSVEDCIEYQPLTSNAHQSRWTIPSNATVTYNSSGMKVTGSSWADLYLSTQISKPCSIEWQMGPYSNMLFSIYLWDTAKSTRYLSTYEFTNGSTPNRLIFDIYNSTSNYVNFVPNSGDMIRIEITSNQCRLYVNDVMKISKTHSHTSPFVLGLGTSNNRYSTYKNLKIKSL